MTEQQQGHFARLDIDNYREHFAPGDHTLVDVREPEEWVMGRIPGAMHIPLNDLPERFNEIPTDQPVVVVCAHGQRSLFGAQFLLQAGFPEVYSLEGGTHAWMMKRLPIER